MLHSVFTGPPWNLPSHKKLSHSTAVIMEEHKIRLFSFFVCRYFCYAWINMGRASFTLESVAVSSQIHLGLLQRLMKCNIAKSTLWIWMMMFIYVVYILHIVLLISLCIVPDWKPKRHWLVHWFALFIWNYYCFMLLLYFIGKELMSFN